MGLKGVKVPLIGNGYLEKHVADQHPGGTAWWYPLYGSDGHGGYSLHTLWNGRGEFNFHTGLESDGCVTAPSQFPKGSASYPASRDFNAAKQLIDNSKPFEYKPGDSYKGWLHVK